MPSAEPLFLGLDVGTTGTKCVVIDTRGAVVAEATAEHPVSYPKPGWAEQDPEDWWRSSVAATRAALAKASAASPDAAARVDAIGLSGQMHGLVALDASGTVVRPAVLWNDSRSAAICDALH